MVCRNQLYVEELLWSCCHDYQNTVATINQEGEEQQSTKSYRWEISAQLISVLVHVVDYYRIDRTLEMTSNSQQKGEK